MEILQQIPKKSLKYALEPFRSIKEKISLLNLHVSEEGECCHENFFDHIVELEESVKEMFSRIQDQVIEDDTSSDHNSMEECNKCLEYLDQLKSVKKTIPVKDYIATIENVSDKITQALLLWNKLSVNKILQNLSKIQENVSLFLQVKREEELLNAFKINVKSLIYFMGIMDTYLLDLQLEHRKHDIIVCIHLIYKWFMLLCKVLKLCMKKPCDNLVEKGCTFIVNHIKEVLNKIGCLVRGDPSEKYFEHCMQPGHFVHMMDQLLELLSDLPNSSMSEIDNLVTILIQHSATVAKSSTQLEKNNLLENTEKVKYLHSVLTEKMQTYLENNERYEIDSDEFSLSLEQMELNLNLAILQQIVDTFVETTQPLNRFIKAATDFNDASEIPALTTLHQKLNNHIELMCNVSNFAINCATNTSSIQQIQVCCYLLKELSEEIGTAIIASTVMTSDKTLLYYINILASEWTETLKILIKNIDDITEPVAFSQMSATKLRENFTEYLEALKQQDTEKLEFLSCKLFNYADRMAQVIQSQHCQNTSRKSDSLLVYVNQLEDALSIVKRRRKQIKVDPGSLTIYHKLTKDLKLILNLSAVIEKELLQYGDLSSSEASFNFDLTMKTPGSYNVNVSKIGNFSTRSIKKKMAMSNYVPNKDCSVDSNSRYTSMNNTCPLSEVTGLNITGILEKMEDLSIDFMKEIKCSQRNESSEISTQVSTPERLKDIEMLNLKMNKLRQLQNPNNSSKDSQ